MIRQKRRAGYLNNGNVQPLSVVSGGTVVALLANSEYFRAAGGTDALGCRSLVLHDDALAQVLQ